MRSESMKLKQEKHESGRAGCSWMCRVVFLGVVNVCGCHYFRFFVCFYFSLWIFILVPIFIFLLKEQPLQIAKASSTKPESAFVCPSCSGSYLQTCALMARRHQHGHHRRDHYFLLQLSMAPDFPKNSHIYDLGLVQRLRMTCSIS